MCSCKAKRGALLGILIVAAFAACSESATDTSPQPDEVVVEPSEAILYVGDTLRLSATVYDTEGNPIEGAVNWESLQPEVADVDATGLVTAYASGRIDIYAVYVGSAGAAAVSGSSLITVNCVTPPPVPLRITTDPEAQHNSAIWGNRIVWVDWRNYNATHGDIYSYDIVAQSETRLTADTVWQGDPDIWEDYLVWSDTRDGPTSIRMRDLSNGQEQRLGFGAVPRIKDGRAVWESMIDGQWEIFVYDISTGGSQRLTDDPADQMTPVVASHWVAWSDDSTGDFDVVVYDLDTDQVIRLTDGAPNDQIVTDISGDLVVWQDNWLDIYVHDLSSGQRTRLTDGTGARLAAIDSPWVAWESNWIVVRNVETGEQLRLSDVDAGHIDADISGRRFVWTRWDVPTAEEDIYMAEIPEPCQNNYVSERRP